jgi:hypothetical protein
MNKLTDTYKIADYLEKTFRSWGLRVEPDFSGLSDSRYLEIDLSKDDDTIDRIKIRISNHDLPPSYDRGRGGSYDYDVYTDSLRNGNTGSTWSYAKLIKKFAEKLGKPLPAHIITLDKKEAEKQARYEIQSKIDYEKAAAEEAHREAAVAWARVNRPDDYEFIQKRDILHTIKNPKRNRVRYQIKKRIDLMAELMDRV